jgi:hypothetical protein
LTAVDDRPVYALKTRPAVLNSYDEAIDCARALKPRLRERVAEAERLRRLPAENVADLLENGLYGLMTPRVHMLWTAHMWMLAQFPLDTQQELWTNPNMLASSVVNTVGDVEPVEGGYRWTGRGFFSSGVDHCNWLTAAVPIKRQGAEGPPEMRWLLIPREDFEIVDDWFTVGLKGTGSKTIVVDRIFIPERRSVAGKDVEEGVAPGHRVHAHRMYGAISWANFTAATAAPAVGVARGFLGAYEDRLRSKSSAIDDGLIVNMARYAQRLGDGRCRPRRDAPERATLCAHARQRGRPRDSSQVPPRSGVYRADGAQSGQHAV